MKHPEMQGLAIVDRDKDGGVVRQRPNLILANFRGDPKFRMTRDFKLSNE